MNLKIDIPIELKLPAIKSLSLSMFDKQDHVNMILQRSEILYDNPKAGAVIREWNGGNMEPILAEVDRLGDEIAYRTAAVIHTEYRNLAPVIQNLAPKSVTDIGCGYAFVDYFVARDHGAKLTLIDLESNERRHFGFKKEGAAYSSLSQAKEMLVANNVAADNVLTVNPEKQDVLNVGKADLVTSYLSCGFHYPVSLYGEFFSSRVEIGGHVIIDLRESTATKQLRDMKSYGLTAVENLDSANKVSRVLLRKVK